MTWLRPRFPEYGPAQLLLWIERFFRLWRRFPILLGGFKRELAELRAYAAKLKSSRPRLSS